MPSIIKRIILLLVASAGIFGAVCGPRIYEEFQKSGAGGSSTASASGARLTAIYGLRPETRLGFLILIQFPKPGASTSASSSWVGSATHGSETRVAYEASLSSIDINGSSYDFEAGRVFFAQAKSGTVEVHQLEVEIQDAPYSKEIDRIATTQAIEDLIQ